MSPKIAPAPIHAVDMEHGVLPVAEADSYGLDPIYTQSSSVRLTAFGSLAQSPLPQEENRRSFFSQDGAAGALQSEAAPPRLSYLQSMGSASSDQPLIETPGYIAIESHRSAASERPPSPSQSNDSR